MWCVGGINTGGVWVRVPMRLLVGLLGLVAVASGQSTSTLDFYMNIANAPLNFNAVRLLYSCAKGR